MILIYGLIDPRSGCLRYIGQSKRPKKRLWRHCNPTSHDRSHRGCWLRGLRNAGLEPQFVELEEVTFETAAIIEAFWIASLRAAGVDLVNTTDGEQAPSRRGFTLTLEHRAKIAASHLGIRPTEATRAKMEWTSERRANMETAYAMRHPRHIKKHGTWSSYDWGCRCLDCRAFINSKAPARRDGKPRQPRFTPQHGTTTMYSKGCRCDSCRSTAVSYAMKRQALRKLRKEVSVPSERVLLKRQAKRTLRRKRALELIQRHGHVSTAMLAHDLGLSTSTFEPVMRALVTEGVLRAAGKLGYVLATRIRARQMPGGRLAAHQEVTASL